jgi:Tol biopolymer transport system component
MVTTLSPPLDVHTPGIFEEQADIGATAIAGSSRYDSTTDTLSVTGSGANIWGTEDAFRFAWSRWTGDAHIAADVAFVGAGVDPHRKAGLMVRQNNSSGSPYADVMLHGDGLIAMQYREVQGGPTMEIRSNVTSRSPRLRLEKEGDYVFFSVAGGDGELRHAGGNYRLRLTGEFLVGAAVSSHNNAALETATFRGVQLTRPTLAHVPDTGYPAAVESTLEIMDMTGAESRHVVRHFIGKIEAPNWSKDGGSLIYNSNGLLYRIPVTGGPPAVIDTGAQKKNNNDHGLSPDGTMLAISDQSQPDDQSRIYVLPVTGSPKPRLVVSHPKAPSYWHGWSPDGRLLAFTASRPATADYDIYAKPWKGGAEKRLTTAKGLDDGPEYSPDGKWIYFNSARSGAMQIWRMRPDGSGQQQVTADASLRDWFPHFSPDGKWIVFISFGTDVDVEDHPPNRDVMLRIMPADGSAPPRVLTRLFGGQGTINVPSWSPDSKRIAFVSYRLVR